MPNSFLGYLIDIIANDLYILMKKLDVSSSNDSRVSWKWTDCSTDTNFDRRRDGKSSNDMERALFLQTSWLGL